MKIDSLISILASSLPITPKIRSELILILKNIKCIEEDIKYYSQENVRLEALLAKAEEEKNHLLNKYRG